MKGLLLVLGVGVQLAFATKFPTYIDQCSRSDVKFNGCALRSANKALPHLLQGDPELGLPKLRQVPLETMHLDVTDKVHIVLTNGVGMVEADLILTAVEFDFEQKSLFVSMRTARTCWYVDYEATGTVQDRPLHEKGQANITFGELAVNATVTLDFKTVDGKRYLEATACDANTVSTSYDFNPYNQHTIGQPLSGDQVQEVAALYKQSGLAIRQNSKELANKFFLLELNAIFKFAPFDEMFLP